jgi:hypothetical protein
MAYKIISIVALFSLSAYAFSPNEVVPAEQTKRNLYVSDSTISGGDVKLSSVRWAKNPAGYERLVLDLGSDGAGWEAKTPPYFQVGHDSRTSSISLSIRGVSQRGVNTETLLEAIAKSALLSSAYIAPGIEGDLAALEFRTRAPVRIESFYLVNPPRIVVDVRAKN